MERWLILGGGLLAGLAVVGGAFGTHGLKGRLSPEALEVFETAVRYQMIHGLALLVLAGLASRLPSWGLTLTALLWVIGVTVFSGSLYLLTLTGIRWWGAVTPIGGATMLAGWFALIYAAWSK